MNVYEKNVMHKVGVPFWPIASWFHIKMAEKDVNYIENVIKKDKCYPLIHSAFMHEGLMNMSPCQIAQIKINLIVFYDKFYEAKDCPKGVRRILFTLLGQERHWLNERYPRLLDMRYGYVERWLDTVK